MNPRTISLGGGAFQMAYLRLPHTVAWRREVERRWLKLTDLRLSQGGDLCSAEPMCLRPGVTMRMVADDVTASAARDLSETDWV